MVKSGIRWQQHGRRREEQGLSRRLDDYLGDDIMAFRLGSGATVKRRSSSLEVMDGTLIATGWKLCDVLAIAAMVSSASIPAGPGMRFRDQESTNEGWAMRDKLLGNRFPKTAMIIWIRILVLRLVGGSRYLGREGSTRKHELGNRKQETGKKQERNRKQDTRNMN
jgi:hypothetical protein